MWSLNQTISEVMEAAWGNLIHFVQGCLAVVIMFRLSRDLNLLHRDMAMDSVESQRKIVSTILLEAAPELALHSFRKERSHARQDSSN
jgi:hypothetical protein